MKGLVLSATLNTFKVLCDDGETRLCSIRGKRIKSLAGTYNCLASGDIVDICPTDSGKGLVEGLCNRRNSFGRYNEKGKAEQAIAANVDQVCCVSSPSLPPFRPRFIDRVAALAEYSSLPFAIILNKCDLGIPEEVEDRLAGYEKLGYRVFRVSAAQNEGIDGVRHYIKGKLSVFAGQSGVGKSSLVNVLFPGLERRTQDVSVKYNRGKHTTTMSELLIGPDDTRIIDTPGIRRLALRSIPADSLSSCFPEILAQSEFCALGSKCSHSGEEGCSIIGAVESGKIHPDRYESYLRILSEMETLEAWKRTHEGSLEREAVARKEWARRSKSKDFARNHDMSDMDDGYSEYE
ncbi:MAG: ribosome small subunit-dependent GTPase A [Spirochaetaceae bacterium]|nr:ribosome small subunit-dependent GTPase A [Spirochaetaceae bacterium]